MSEEIIKSQLQGLGTLLQLEQDARHASTEQELAFLIVNNTRHLFAYDQALLFHDTLTQTASLHSVSGIADVDKNAPFVNWSNKVCKHVLQTEKGNQVHILQMDELPDKLKSEWSEWVTGNVLWCPLTLADESSEGILWLSRESDWQENELGIITRLADAYAHAWHALQKKKSTGQRWLSYLMQKKVRLAVITVLILIMFIPVRQTVLAPAEIVPSDPFIVTAPIDGVIRDVLVQPNRPVTDGTPLLIFDDTSIRNQHQIAKKALNVSQAKLLRAEQKSFSDDRSRQEVALLRAEVEQKVAEVKYADELLTRTRVSAQQKGVAIFADSDEWVGKPVALGEKIMVIAQPRQSELKMWLAVDDAIELVADQDVKFFLNIDPTNTLRASITQSSYEARPSVDGSLAFILRASWVSEITDTQRIGLKGTAKLYGKNVSLFYYLFRRPVTAFRQWTGF